MKLDAKLLAAIDELDRLAETRDDALQVPREEGEFLHHVALAIGAKTIVEVGTSYGFSGLWWAAALRHTGGKLHTIDKLPKKYDSSRETFARAGVADLIQNYLGDGQQIITTFPSSMKIDLSFIDADKPATTAYFDLLWPMTRVGGSILIDNATTHREQLADFVRGVRSREDASSTEIAIGNGIEWIVKL